MFALAAGGVLALVVWLVLLLQAVPPADEPLAPVDWQAQPLTGQAQARIDPARSPRARPDPAGPARLAPELTAPPPSGPDAVIGRVRDRITGQAVGAFQVDVLPHDSESPLDRLADSVPQPFHARTGIFRIDQDKGRWDVVVRAPGYEPGFVQGVQVPAVDAKPIPFELTRGAGITGVVHDRSNLAVPRIKVFLHVQRIDDPQAKPPRITIAHTALDGRFHFSPLPPGQYGLSLLEPDNSIDFRGGIRVRDDGQTVDVPMLLTERHQLQIVVRDLRNRTLEGARVTLRGDGRVSSASSNASGIALLEHVPDGSYTLEIVLRGYETAREDVELSGGSGSSLRWIRMSREE